MKRIDTPATAWRKSSYSNSNSNCVEAATLADGIAVRDSKDRTGPVLAFAREQWTAFIAGIKAGELDLP